MGSQETTTPQCGLRPPNVALPVSQMVAAGSAAGWSRLHGDPPVWALKTLRLDRHRHWCARLGRRTKVEGKVDCRTCVPPEGEELVLSQRGTDQFGDVLAVDENPHPAGPTDLQVQTEVRVGRLREGHGSVGLLRRCRPKDPRGAWQAKA